jgi:hypothetical protein
MIDDPVSLTEIIETNLFVDVDSLSANIVIATKSPDGLIDWIELKPEFHCSIVKCVLRLISKHTANFKTASAKEALFPFLIKLLNGRATCTAFFHETKTTMLSKRANRKRKRKVTEKLKVQVENTEMSDVKVDDTEATPPDRAPLSSKMEDPVASSELPPSPPKPSVIPILIPDPPVANLEPAEAPLPEVVQFARWAKANSVPRECETETFAGYCTNAATYVAIHGPFNTACYLKCFRHSAHNGQYIPDAEWW